MKKLTKKDSRLVSGTYWEIFWMCVIIKRWEHFSLFDNKSLKTDDRIEVASISEVPFPNSSIITNLLIFFLEEALNNWKK